MPKQRSPHFPATFSPRYCEMSKSSFERRYGVSQVQLFRWIEKDDGVQELQTECGYHGHILALHMQVHKPFLCEEVKFSSNSPRVVCRSTLLGDRGTPSLSSPTFHDAVFDARFPRDTFTDSPGNVSRNLKLLSSSMETKLLEIRHY